MANTSPLLLLLGDSLIDYGEWHRRLPEYRTISSGIPGETTSGLLSRLPSGLSGGDPDGIILMSGTNDLMLGYQDFVQTLDQISVILRSNFPQSEMIITSLLPYEIPGLLELIRSVNEELTCVAEKNDCHYFDLFAEFENSFAPLFDYDGVHLSNSGYELWAQCLIENLPGLLVKGRN